MAERDTETQFPKKLSEKDAASYFVRCILEESKASWPSIHETLQQTHSGKFVVQDSQMAGLDMALAAIAMGLQAVNNLFPPEQAARIRRWVFVDIKDSWAVDEVEQYERALREQTSDGADPFGAICGRLIHRWLGKNIRDVEAKIQGQKTGFINSLLMAGTLAVLSDLALKWNWKLIKQNVELVAEEGSEKSPVSAVESEDGFEVPDIYLSKKAFMRRSWFTSVNADFLITPGFYCAVRTGKVRGFDEPMTVIAETSDSFQDSLHKCAHFSYSRKLTASERKRCHDLIVQNLRRLGNFGVPLQEALRTIRDKTKGEPFAGGAIYTLNKAEEVSDEELSDMTHSGAPIDTDVRLKRVLIIYQDPVEADRLRTYLNHHEFEALAVYSKAPGLRCAVRFKPNVALLESNFDLTLVERISTLVPDAKIILLGSIGNPGFREKWAYIRARQRNVELCLYPFVGPELVMRMKELAISRGPDKPSPMTEEEAIAYFVFFFLSETRRKWSNVLDEFNAEVQPQCQIRDRWRAYYDFCFAAISLNLQSLQSSYAPEQASRIEVRLLDYLGHIAGWGPNAVKEVRGYSEFFRKWLKQVGPGEYPIAAVANRLIARWLGDFYKDYSETSGVAPLYGQPVAALRTLANFWQQTFKRMDLQTTGSPPAKVISSLEGNTQKLRVFMVGDEIAILSYVATLLQAKGYDAVGSLSLRKAGWAFEEVLADAEAFRPNVLMFCINCHLCPQVNSADIPTMLFRRFPESRVIVTRMGRCLNVSEPTYQIFEEKCRSLHILDSPFEPETLLAALHFKSGLGELELAASL